MAESNFSVWMAKKSLGAKARLRLYRKLAGLLSNGVSLQQALDIIYEQASRGGKKKSDPVAIAVDHWRRSYKEGKSFGVALDGWAPVSERMLVEAGEAGSRLDEALRAVIRLNINSSKIRGALYGGLTYPVILFLAVNGILYLFGSMVLPKFDEILPMENWVGSAAVLAKMSIYSQKYLIPVLIASFFAMILFVYTAPRWSNKWRSKFDKFPPWSLYRLVAGGGFLMSVAALVHAGVAVPEVLRKLRRNSNPWMQVRIDAALHKVNQGANLGEALHRSGHDFPDREIVDDLRIYASLASFDESLNSVTEEWIETGVERIQAQAAILNMVMMVTMGLVVMFLVVGLYAIQRQMSQSQMMLR